MGDAASEGRLLIVNHDPAMNLSAECVLWLNGYEPESVDTITEAEKLLRGRRYGLLVCRNAMPDGCGPELMRYAWSAFGIPSVAITQTLTKEQMAARVASDGLRGVMLMPATQRDLLIAVAGAMGRCDFVGPAYRGYVESSEPVPCPDCRGSGYVTLLINRTRCTRCDGSGSTPPDLLDMPIRQAPLPGLARFSLYRAGVTVQSPDWGLAGLWSDKGGMGRSKARVIARCSNCARLERELHQLREELAELRRQVNRNAANSSMPPSVNPPWAPRPVIKKPTGRRPGGQVGHEGHFRVLLPVEEVDEVVRHRPNRCRHCGAEFGVSTPEQTVERHQVTELPQRAVKVTEHQAIACRCARCGLLTRQPIPDPLKRSVLGPRLSAAAVYVSSRVHGSRRASEELLEEVLGVPLALGTVMAREKEMTAALAQPYQAAKAAVQNASAKHVDETGWKRAGRFLWVAATQRLAVFHLAPCRNRDAMHQLLGTKVKRTICTDRFGVYAQVPLERRGLCWAHLKRDFTELAEQKAGGKRIGDAGLKLAARVFDLWRQLREKQISRATLRQRVDGPLRHAMNHLLERGTRCRLKRAAKFCRELLRLEPALWTFARVKGIEPTNNHAERMLRPAVIWRKTSQGSHALSGCRFVERILTAVQTLQLQGRSIMNYLEEAIHAWRHGLSPPPLLA